uniref:Uncharacterized protein n=1 Tax=Cucumis melo TaxID=3656 RepID=A0A9I9E710_CUCME
MKKKQIRIFISFSDSIPFCFLRNYADRRLLDLCWRFPPTGRPNTPQNPQPANFGEEGSPLLGGGDGDIASILYAPEDRVRSNEGPPPDPTLREGLNSPERKTTLCWSSWKRFVGFNSPLKNLSSHTKPEEPCRRNDTADLCNSAMFILNRRSNNKKQ